ncbi:ATP-dependent RNA helicase DDX1 [Plasmodium brasilianum]|uniref:ATP-dependent RNA helicase n=2 Tax=Plasmodium (Plasmodium) TaxID=418103 RepID=A0A1A8W0F6_PLAMA|nr:ATP-dependent RNA helicase DDX1, putative [Plasmodium malariae]KAI4837765.1 ATP-dependent RNA helicase DDX1 [Plasmodium brasilianum]SBS86245.1 DEAD-box subfamily ATP-dependant helicase [Plasmodium malariae]SCN44754.1 ATP-dependent RNA helicase DDX1, putative [Plasmodium malariae]
MSAFEELGLDSTLCELLETNGIDLPTAIQQESIPLILGGGDLCACAETGTGKTLSFIVSSLQIVHELLRNIGTYEINSSDYNNGNKENIHHKSLKEDDKNGNKELIIRSLNNSNSKVRIMEDTNECILLSTSNNSNYFEEIKVECEIVNGLYAFEVEILQRSFINIGFCPSLVKETSRYNYTYCSNGCKYTNNRQENYGDFFSTNDIITCLINKNSNIIAFKKNGKFLGNAFKIFYKYNDIPFFPYVCGKYFHIKFHFKNLKYVDSSLYKELNDIINTRKEDSDCRRTIYLDMSTDGNRRESEVQYDHGNRNTNNRSICGSSTNDGGITNISISNNTSKKVNIDETNKNKLYCIVLVPTRDLAMQTYNNYLIYAQCFSGCSINVGLLVGGGPPMKEKRNSAYNIVVCTCFKLMEYLKKNNINVNDVRLLILDEADELINTDEKSVLEIKDVCMRNSQHVQTCFFSATLQDKNVKDCINKITNKPLFVDLKYGKNYIPSHIYVCIYYVNDQNSSINSNLSCKGGSIEEKTYEDIIYNEKLNSMNNKALYEYTDKVHLLNCNRDGKEMISLDIKINKLKKLIHIINVFNMQNGIIFCRTNLDCDNVYNFLNFVGDGKAYKGTVESLKENKYSCVILKGKMSNEERKNNLNAFKKGEVRFLICTDVAARGIDIQNLRYLIIMTLSDNINTFFHKIGRVGRDGKNSLCIVLSAQNQEEKVWFHTCPSRGQNCNNRNLKEYQGCTVYIKESDYIQTINNMLEIPMHVLDSKYYYAENVVDPLNYFKSNPTSNKSRRNKNQNVNSIFSEPANASVLNCFSSSIHNIQKLQSAISYKHYELSNFII